MPDIIELPAETQTIEQKLEAALYAANHYHRPTKIIQGHRAGYLISEDMWERAKAALAHQPPPDPSPPHTPGTIFGIPAERLRLMPVHEATCALVTTHHLTCTCGAFSRQSPTAPHAGQ